MFYIILKAQRTDIDINEGCLSFLFLNSPNECQRGFFFPFFFRRLDVKGGEDETLIQWLKL